MDEEPDCKITEDWLNSKECQDLIMLREWIIDNHNNYTLEQLHEARNTYATVTHSYKVFNNIIKSRQQELLKAWIKD
jgi:hypothetical protein